MQTAWHWWRTLPTNPVYLRERGQWGDPNPVFSIARRYSPLIVSGALFMALCSGISSILLAGTDADELALLWCQVCLSGIAVQTLSLIGTMLAPALTAPTVSREISMGTWDTLNVIPQSSASILWAKFMGALARLRLVWVGLLAASILQTLLLACTAMVATATIDEATSMLLLSNLVGVVLGGLRPWLEVLFAACIGLYLSTRLATMTSALAASYGAIVIMRIVASSLLWGGAGLAFNWSRSGVLLLSSILPTLVYMLAVIALIWATSRRAALVSATVR